jgi:hypothetical protein
MPALSKKQQKFMGIVRSIQKGEQPASNFSKDAQDVAKDMKKKDVKDFASTKHKGLPMKKEVLNKLKEMIKQELSEYTYGVGDVVKDVNPTCPHFGAQGKVKSVNPRSVIFIVKNKGKNFKPGMELEKSHDQMKKMKESVNEMSAKTKKIISKLGKKEKEMFIDMVDMLGFDQVMADYKRDKKAFKQALKDMTENIIKEEGNEVQTGKQYTKLWLQAIDLTIKQANGLKGPLSKHPIKRDVNKLKAVENLFRKFIKPAIEREGSNKSYYAPNITRLKKYLSDSKFKAAVKFILMDTLKSGSFRQNSWYFLGDKEKSLIKKMVSVLYGIENKLDKSNLENVNESMNPSAVKKMRDEFEKTGQLPPHLKKFALDLKILKKKHKVKNIVVPGLEWMSDIKEVNESKELDTIEKIVKSAKNFMDVGSALKRVRIKSDFQTSMGLPRYTFKLNGKRYGILNKKNVSKPDRVVGDIAFGVMESINEDGHTDVASAKRKAMLMVEYSNKLLNKLNGMNKEDSLPSWLSDKITLASDYLHKATHYLLNPVESVNEGKGVEKVLKMANDQSFGKLGGRTVDALSAGLFKGVYDKASDKNKEKINKMNEKQLYVFMTKLWSKFGNQVRIS